MGCSVRRGNPRAGVIEASDSSSPGCGVKSGSRRTRILAASSGDTGSSGSLPPAYVGVWASTRLRPACLAL